MYFFQTCVSIEVLRDYKDELLFFYQGKLEATLKELNYDGYIPSLRELQTEFLRRGIFGEKIIHFKSSF